MLKDTCLRACAKPSPMQNFIAPPFDPATKTCRVYMPMGGLGTTLPPMPAPMPAHKPAPARVARKSRRAPAKPKSGAVDGPHADEDAKPR
jgi:hypothetical protein